MITGVIKAHPSLRIFVFLSVILALLPAFALSEETYKFERMWPALQQSWYFNHPCGIAVDANGNIYVADEGNNRIQKFSPDGALITRWGSLAEGNGQFSRPRWIAVDGSGHVYVTDSVSVHKFTSGGEFLTRRGSQGSGNGEFYYPEGITVDQSRKCLRG